MKTQTESLSDAVEKEIEAMRDRIMSAGEHRDFVAEVNQYMKELHQDMNNIGSRRDY